MGLCVRIWDNILVFGTRFIFKVALAILKLLKNELLNKEMDEINQFFTSLNNQNQTDDA